MGAASVKRKTRESSGFGTSPERLSFSRGAPGETHMPEAIQVSTKIAAPPKEVWKALTTPETIKSYFFGADVETDWEEGSPITFSGDWKGEHFQDKGEIITFAPERRLAYSHWSPLSNTEDAPENYHKLTFDLARDDNGTRVTLRQDAAPGEDVNEKTLAEWKRNWETLLDGLKKAAEH
jgi:uncharacterized protein YndB with AHSA1/START domain